MCGILAVQSKNGKSAIKPLLKRYRHQASRGKLGFGYVTVNDKGFVSDVVRSTTEAEIVESLLKETENFVMFHHRTPTSLPNYKEATHPFVVKSDKLKYNYIVIHNGVITNHKPLFEQFKKDGWIFTTEMVTGDHERFVNVEGSPAYGKTPESKINDSEVFAIDLARWSEGEYDAFKSYGSIAFIALQTTKAGKVVNLIYGHNQGSPLTEENDKTIYALKSVGHGREVEEMKIFIKDWQTGEVTTKHANGMIGSYYPRKTEREDDNRWGGMGFGRRGEDSEAETEHSKTRRHKASLEGQLEGLKDSPFWIEARKRQEEREEARLLMSGAQQELDWDAPSQAELDAEYDKYLEENEMPVIEMEDFGFSEEALKLEISNAEFSGNTQTAKMIRDLRDDLIEAIDDENDANKQLNVARSMLAECWKREDDVQDVNTAKELVESYMGVAKIARDNRIAIQAELEAHVADNHGTRDE